MKIAIKIFVPFLILFAAFLGFKALVASKAEPQSKQPPAVIPEVTYMEASPTTHSPPILTYGTVQAYFETTLTPQISGKIVTLDDQFRVGKTIPAGFTLATIDRTDFEAALATQEANLINAKRTLAEEQVRSDQAKQDWTISGRKLADASPFALRTPQLEAAQADIKSVEAAISKAQEDLNRTEIKAPFDAIVTARNVSKGDLASPQSPLGTLVATERAEIRLPLTIEQTNRAIDLTGESTADITLTTPTKPGIKWNAKITRTEPTVDPQNQITFVLAEIKNPYAKQPATLPVGTFVNAELPSIPITNAYAIPETALINDSYIWIISDDDTLLQISVERIFSQKQTTYVQAKETLKNTTLKILTRPQPNFAPNQQVKPSSPH